jgi:hypothetical protein
MSAFQSWLSYIPKLFPVLIDFKLDEQALDVILSREIHLVVSFIVLDA